MDHNRYKYSDLIKFLRNLEQATLPNGGDRFSSTITNSLYINNTTSNNVFIKSYQRYEGNADNDIDVLASMRSFSILGRGDKPDSTGNDYDVLHNYSYYNHVEAGGGNDRIIDKMYSVSRITEDRYHNYHQTFVDGGSGNDQYVLDSSAHNSFFSWQSRLWKAIFDSSIKTSSVKDTNRLSGYYGTDGNLYFTFKSNILHNVETLIHKYTENYKVTNDTINLFQTKSDMKINSIDVDAPNLVAGSNTHAELSFTVNASTNVDNAFHVDTKIVVGGYYINSNGVRKELYFERKSATGEKYKTALVLDSGIATGASSTSLQIKGKFSLLEAGMDSADLLTYQSLHLRAFIDNTTAQGRSFDNNGSTTSSTTDNGTDGYIVSDYYNKTILKITDTGKEIKISVDSLPEGYVTNDLLAGNIVAKLVKSSSPSIDASNLISDVSFVDINKRDFIVIKLDQNELSKIPGVGLNEYHLTLTFRYLGSSKSNTWNSELSINKQNDALPVISVLPSVATINHQPVLDQAGDIGSFVFTYQDIDELSAGNTVSVTVDSIKYKGVVLDKVKYSSVYSSLLKLGSITDLVAGSATKQVKIHIQNNDLLRQFYGSEDLEIDYSVQVSDGINTVKKTGDFKINVTDNKLDLLTSNFLGRLTADSSDGIDFGSVSFVDVVASNTAISHTWLLNLSRDISFHGVKYVDLTASKTNAGMTLRYKITEKDYGADNYLMYIDTGSDAVDSITGFEQASKDRIVFDGLDTNHVFSISKVNHSQFGYVIILDGKFIMKDVEAINVTGKSGADQLISGSQNTLLTRHTDMSIISKTVDSEPLDTIKSSFVISSAKALDTANNNYYVNVIIEQLQANGDNSIKMPIYKQVLASEQISLKSIAVHNTLALSQFQADNIYKFDLSSISNVKNLSNSDHVIKVEVFSRSKTDVSGPKTYVDSLSKVFNKAVIQAENEFKPLPRNEKFIKLYSNKATDKTTITKLSDEAYTVDFDSIPANLSSDNSKIVMSVNFNDIDPDDTYMIYAEGLNALQANIVKVSMPQSNNGKIIFEIDRNYLENLKASDGEVKLLDAGDTFYIASIDDATGAKKQNIISLKVDSDLKYTGVTEAADYYQVTPLYGAGRSQFEVDITQANTVHSFVYQLQRKDGSSKVINNIGDVKLYYKGIDVTNDSNFSISLDSNDKSKINVTVKESAYENYGTTIINDVMKVEVAREGVKYTSTDTNVTVTGNLINVQVTDTGAMNSVVKIVEFDVANIDPSIHDVQIANLSLTSGGNSINLNNFIETSIVGNKVQIKFKKTSDIYGTKLTFSDSSFDVIVVEKATNNEVARRDFKINVKDAGTSKLSILDTTLNNPLVTLGKNWKAVDAYDKDGTVTLSATMKIKDVDMDNLLFNVYDKNNNLLDISSYSYTLLNTNGDERTYRVDINKDSITSYGDKFVSSNKYIDEYKIKVTESGSGGLSVEKTVQFDVKYLQAVSEIDTLSINNTDTATAKISTLNAKIKSHILNSSDKIDGGINNAKVTIVKDTNKDGVWDKFISLDSSTAVLDSGYGNLVAGTQADFQLHYIIHYKGLYDVANPLLNSSNVATTPIKILGTGGGNIDTSKKTVGTSINTDHDPFKDVKIAFDVNKKSYDGTADISSLKITSSDTKHHVVIAVDYSQSMFYTRYNSSKSLYDLQESIVLNLIDKIEASGVNILDINLTLVNYADTAKQQSNINASDYISLRNNVKSHLATFKAQWQADYANGVADGNTNYLAAIDTVSQALGNFRAYKGGAMNLQDLNQSVYFLSDGVSNIGSSSNRVTDLAQLDAKMSAFRATNVGVNVNAVAVQDQFSQIHSNANSNMIYLSKIDTHYTGGKTGNVYNTKSDVTMIYFDNEDMIEFALPQDVKSSNFKVTNLQFIVKNSAGKVLYESSDYSKDLVMTKTSSASTADLQYSISNITDAFKNIPIYNSADNTEYVKIKIIDYNNLDNAVPVEQEYLLNIPSNIEIGGIIPSEDGAIVS